MSAALFAKLRKKGPGHAKQTEDVGRIHRLQLRIRDFFDRSCHTVTGVVHQHINPAKTLERRSDSVIYLLLIGYIQGESEGMIGIFLRKIGDLLADTRTPGDAP